MLRRTSAVRLYPRRIGTLVSNLYFSEMKAKMIGSASRIALSTPSAMRRQSPRINTKSQIKQFNSRPEMRPRTMNRNQPSPGSTSHSSRRTADWSRVLPSASRVFAYLQKNTNWAEIHLETQRMCPLWSRILARMTQNLLAIDAYPSRKDSSLAWVAITWCRRNTAASL